MPTEDPSAKKYVADHLRDRRLDQIKIVLQSAHDLLDEEIDARNGPPRKLERAYLRQLQWFVIRALKLMDDAA